MEKEPKWNAVKSARLKKVRGLSFEDILKAKFIVIKDHHSREDQKIMFYEYKNQIWLVPFIKKDNEVFLKTLYPSRKYTRLYKKGELL